MADRRRALTLAELEDEIVLLRQEAGQRGLAASIYEAEAEEDRKRAGRKDELAAQALASERRLLCRADELEDLRLALRPPRGLPPVDIGQTKRDHILDLHVTNPSYTEAELARFAGTSRYQVRKVIGRRTDYRSVDKPAGNVNRGAVG